MGVGTGARVGGRVGAWVGGRLGGWLRKVGLGRARAAGRVAGIMANTTAGAWSRRAPGANEEAALRLVGDRPLHPAAPPVLKLPDAKPPHVLFSFLRRHLRPVNIG